MILYYLYFCTNGMCDQDQKYSIVVYGHFENLGYIGYQEVTCRNNHIYIKYI